ncbi:MAG: Pimeloyl-ACP methyl ester carboxylesterase [Chloroflexi bacterium]|nr:Pimeloyl-ACP methyl ester carboxylesterase [Chloroflexota bacterium]
MTKSQDAEKIQGYVDAGNLRTYYEAEGSGDPLVLLHGGLCTIETFSGLTPKLAERYRVYLPERRAHGRTADVAGPITYEIMAHDTIAFLKAVNLSSAHLVGWSDGAVVGLLVALRRPDLVRRLVLIGQAINPEGVPPEVVEMMKLDKMPDMLPPMLRDMYAAVSPDGPEHWEVVVDKVWQMIRTEPNIPLAELEKVSAPTLVIVADHDFPTVEHAKAMQRSLPDSRLEVVPDATHGLPMEKPDVVAGLVLEFLAEDH